MRSIVGSPGERGGPRTRAKVLVGSLLVHAVIGVLLIAIAPHATVEPPRASVAIEVVDRELPLAPRPELASSPGGGSPAPSTQVVATRAPRARTSQLGTARGRIVDDPDARRSDAEPRAAITFDEPSGTGSSADDGEGTGRGGGRGAGIGFGDGGAIERTAPPPTPPPAPPPPKVSRARPARLIYPSRQRDVDDGELFVMQVTVDRDGFVAGARLVRGFGGRRDEVASQQIWRFRYDPARDDDGRPIRSTVEQRFLVQ